MRDAEPTVLVGGPVEPGSGDAFQIFPGGVAAGDRLLGDGRLANAVGPHAAPVRALLGGGVGPERSGRGDVGETGPPRPGQQAAARVGFGAVGVGDRAVDAQPVGQGRVFRVPGHRCVVPVARGHHAAGTAYPAHLTECGHRVGQMLQHLVGVYDVEGVVRVGQCVDVGDRELDVGHAPLGRQRGGLVEDGRGGVDRGDQPGRDPGRDVHGDGSRATAHVEHSGAGTQPVGDVGRGVGDGTGPVRAQHRVVVSVGVHGIGGHRRPLPGAMSRP